MFDEKFQEFFYWLLQRYPSKYFQALLQRSLHKIWKTLPPFLSGICPEISTAILQGMLRGICFRKSLNNLQDDYSENFLRDYLRIPFKDFPPTTLICRVLPRKSAKAYSRVFEQIRSRIFHELIWGSRLIPTIILTKFPHDFFFSKNGFRKSCSIFF